jgi:hypothetical protein
VPLIDTSGDTRTRDTTGGVIESRHLRRSVGQFVTGVTVVTYESDGRPRGVTVSSFTSVSVDPPLILVSIARTARAAAPACAAHPGGGMFWPLTSTIWHDISPGSTGTAYRFRGQGITTRRGCAAPSPGSNAGPTPKWTPATILFLSRVTAHRTLGREPLLVQTGGFRLVGDHVGPQPAPEAGVPAWLLISQAQMLAEAGVPPHDATG